MKDFSMMKLNKQQGLFISSCLFLFLTSLVLFLALAPSALAADNASDMAAGTWTVNPRYLTFGRYNSHHLIWRVLEVKDNDSDFNGIKTAFLLLDDLLRENDGNLKITEYDRSNNSFPDSEIMKLLNDGKSGFIAALDAYQANILNTKYAPDNPPHQWAGGVSGGASKVFLLSAGEADKDKYFANDADRVVSNNVWWLRSPGFENDIAAIVIRNGIIAWNGSHVSMEHAIRPALKIDISPSSVFAAVPVSYGLIIKACDGINPISGAKLSLTPQGISKQDGVNNSIQLVQSYSDSNGIALFTHVLPDDYTITVSKPGYTTESVTITVPMDGIPEVSMMPGQTVLPNKVKFGKYSGEPIEWSVLDIVNNKALLFAGALFYSQYDTEGSSDWAKSTLRALLNSSAEGVITGFLHEDNFTAAEAAAIDAMASPTGDPVYLFSTDEVQKYLPDSSMRYCDDKSWITRSPRNEEDVEVITPDGEFGDSVEANTRRPQAWVRPVMWVDLSVLTYDSGTNMILPAPKQ